MCVCVCVCVCVCACACVRVCVFVHVRVPLKGDIIEPLLLTLWMFVSFIPFVLQEQLEESTFFHKI